MRFVRHLQHWLCGNGPEVEVADFVPAAHPVRLWADTFLWDALVEAIDVSLARRFPKSSQRGRRPVATHVLLALELLKHEMGASDEQICHRLRTDFAIMYACGIDTVDLCCPKDHFVLPESLAQFRRRLDDELMDDLLAIQTAAAMDEGLISPAQLLVDTFPSEQGTQRVNDAATLYHAQKSSCKLSTASLNRVRRMPRPSKTKPASYAKTCPK